MGQQASRVSVNNIHTSLFYKNLTFNPGARRYVTIQTNWGDWRFEVVDADSSPRPGTPGQIVNIAHQLQPRHPPHPPAAQQARDQDQDKREE